MADIFDVIADPTRRVLLQALLERQTASDPPVVLPSGPAGAGEMGVGELVQQLSLSQPTVSKHLKVLREANLVTVRELGQRRYYSLTASPMAEVQSFVDDFLDSGGSVGPELAPGDESIAVFAAWAGGNLPAPLRRAAGTFENSEDTGTAIGRAVADASFRTRTALDDAASEVRQRVIDPIAKRVRK